MKMTTPVVPYIPESAPFTNEQRAWLNGFLAGMFSAGPNGAGSPPEAAAASPAGTLLICFGSQTGGAERIAKALARECPQRGFTARLHPLNDYEAAGFAIAKRVVIISSTWGDGDPPDNAVGFWNWLRADSAPRLEGMEFAVLSLGDKSYSSFCGAGRKFDERLAALGARCLLPRVDCDADYEAATKAWGAALWSALATPTPGPEAGTTPAPVPAPAAAVAVAPPVPAAPALVPAAVPVAALPPARLPAAYTKAHPFPARLLKNVVLNGPGSAKEVRHYEIALGGSGLTYEAGDALGVSPTNCSELVEAVLAAAGSTGDEPVALEQAVVPLRLALAENFELGRPPGELLAELARRAPAAEFVPLLAPERAQDLKTWLHGRDVLDLLLLAPGAIAAGELPRFLRKLSPRLYSIASSAKAHPGEVHLTVSSVRYEAHGRARKGVASTFLADRAGDIVRIYVKPAPGFHPPVSAEAPMIMVGPGTGIAPFRAFLEERAATGATGKNWLFFGDQTRAGDFLYEEQLVAWHRTGLLTRLDLAFSRDQAEKLYVQDRMRENAAELWSWLEAGGCFYVCGDAGRMAKDVDAMLHRVIETAGGRTADEAKAYVQKMRAEKRYQRDVY